MNPTLLLKRGNADNGVQSSLSVYPSDETSPIEPLPTDPTNASDPTDPADATDLFDPTTNYTLTVTPPSNGKIVAAEWATLSTRRAAPNDANVFRFP